MWTKSFLVLFKMRILDVKEHSITEVQNTSRAGLLKKKIITINPSFNPYFPYISVMPRSSRLSFNPEQQLGSLLCFLPSLWRWDWRFSHPSLWTRIYQCILVVSHVLRALSCYHLSLKNWMYVMASSRFHFHFLLQYFSENLCIKSLCLRYSKFLIQMHVKPF